MMFVWILISFLVGSIFGMDVALKTVVKDAKFVGFTRIGTAVYEIKRVTKKPDDSELETLKRPPMPPSPEK